MISRCSPDTYPGSVCLAAILKGEEAFTDEWILYHRMLGVSHFFLYDDDEAAPLKTFLRPHRDYVTVIPWHGKSQSLPGRDRQTKAYLHALHHGALGYEWVAFLDGDEFVTLRKHAHLQEFLSQFPRAGSISLQWHVFGHNGYYDDPPGLITASLTRRMHNPDRNVKTISRTACIADITTAHFCRLQAGYRVDANNRNFTEELYPGKSDIAHINHYQCRSFKRWMERVVRGVPCLDAPAQVAPHELWRTDADECLKKFVTTVALNKNEFVDEFMLRYQQPLEAAVAEIRMKRAHQRKVPR